MGRALARLGARLGTPKPIVLCPWQRDGGCVFWRDPQAGGRASAEEPVLYSDEVDIHLNPKIGRDWMLRGHQRRVVTPGQEREVLPRWRARRADRTPAYHGRRQQERRALLPAAVASGQPYRRARRIHLIVDNYGIHSATRPTRLARLGGRIVLHFLPPYCPDANRIERVWQDLHANVTRNHRCKTLDPLLDNARRYLDAYRWKRAVANPSSHGPRDVCSRITIADFSLDFARSRRRAR